MANTHVFPQDGDDDDAANFGQLVGQSNLTGFVERGLDLTVDYTVPDATVSTGLAFVSENTATAPQSGESRLNPNYAVQLAQTTVSLTDNDVNFVYVEPDLGTDDNASVVVYTNESNATTNALKIAEVDTSANTKTELNRRPDIEAFEIDVADDIVDDSGTVIWDDSNDYVPQGRLENDSVDVAGNSVSLGGSTTVDYVDLSDTGTSFPIPNTDLSNSSVSVAGNSVSLGDSTTVDYVDLNDTSASFPIPNTDLSNSSVSVAGNSVSLGGSTTVDYVDLNDTGASFPIPNGDLSNSSVSVAGNTVSLGGSTTVDYVDLNDTASSFPIPNTDLANSSVTVTTGDGLKSGGSVSLGGSVTLDTEPADFAGTFLSDDGTDNLQVDIGRGLEADGTGQIQFDEDTSYTFTSDQTFNAGLNLATGQSIEGGSGSPRLRVKSGRTELLDANENLSIVAEGGSRVGINLRAGETFNVFDVEGGFKAFEYQTNASAPGTLELGNAEIDLNGNNLTNIGNGGILQEVASGSATINAQSREVVLSDATSEVTVFVEPTSGKTQGDSGVEVVYSGDSGEVELFNKDGGESVTVNYTAYKVVQ